MLHSTIQLPDLKAIYLETLERTGDPFKAFVETQVEFVCALSVAVDSDTPSRPDVEEILYQQLASVRSHPHLDSYCRGAINGLVQGSQSVIQMLANLGPVCVH
jgi:hypothetical protein